MHSKVITDAAVNCIFWVLCAWLLKRTAEYVKSRMELSYAKGKLIGNQPFPSVVPSVFCLLSMR